MGIEFECDYCLNPIIMKTNKQEPNGLIEELEQLGSYLKSITDSRFKLILESHQSNETNINEIQRFYKGIIQALEDV